MAVKSFIKELVHVGVPTAQVQPNEQYLDFLKIYITDPGDSPFQIEYVRFMEGTPLPAILQTAPHVAIKVDSIEEASKGCQILGKLIDVPDMYLQVQFIKKDGIIFELMKSTK